MEVFYEDIMDTFLFFFLAALGVIQVMAARRGWHGLCVYGGRLRRGVNYALGGALLAFSYAWYFSDPLHRNVRNIEALMSLVCLFLGCLAAAAATALAASLAEAVRRRLRRNPLRGTVPPAYRSLCVEDAAVLVTDTWGRKGTNLVVVGEPGREGERLAARILSLLPPDRGMLCVMPSRPTLSCLLADSSCAGRLTALIRESCRRADIDPEGETFLGLGWGATLLTLAGEELERDFKPSRLLLLAPVMPDPEGGFLGDALISQTPADVLGCLLQEKPLRDPRLRPLLRIWLPLFLVFSAPATAVMLVLDLRWSLLSGPLMGLVLSLWTAYYAARRKGLLASGPAREPEWASILTGRLKSAGKIPLEVAVAGDDASALDTFYAPAWSGMENVSFRLWERELRGKFFLDRGVEERLRGFLAGGDPLARDSSRGD